ncbi:hypothetical protein PF008_g23927 [Phytophthora fragariae]|uniref:Uncharacterized protein n=1 Tax=Phytophthora fragariae TaxID=53985 RepID=A0A6G0QPB0_9STRA|nr:hypothetical protein PF008_g23927 [Phytophthora fragariae]
MTRVRFGAPSTYSTVQTDSGAESRSTARRGFNRRDVFVRLEPLLEIEVSLSLDESSPSSRHESSFSTAPLTRGGSSCSPAASSCGSPCSSASK